MKQHKYAPRGAEDDGEPGKEHEEGDDGRDELGTRMLICRHPPDGSRISMLAFRNHACMLYTPLFALSTHIHMHTCTNLSIKAMPCPVMRVNDHPLHAVMPPRTPKHRCLTHQR